MGVLAVESPGLNSSFLGLKFVWLYDTLDRVGNGYRLCLLGDLNEWKGDRTRACITGAFRVPGENDNCRRVVEFCAER